MTAQARRRPAVPGRVVPAASSLILVVSPRLFGQGAQWLTLTYLRQALTGETGVAIANSLWVSAAAAVPPSLRDAARAHDAGRLAAWARGVLPVVSRPLLMGWLLTFCGVFLELPISQLLYQPGSPPASVAIQDNLGNYHFGLGRAAAPPGGRAARAGPVTDAAFRGRGGAG